MQIISVVLIWARGKDGRLRKCMCVWNIKVLYVCVGGCVGCR
jgi:hypothetical protein